MENIPVAEKDATFKDLTADPKAFIGMLKKRTTISHLLSRLPSKLRTQWPSRSIVLTHGCMYVFKRDEADEKPCSAYSLYGYYRIVPLEELSETAVEHPFAFVMKFAQQGVGMNLYFASTSDAGRQKWIDQISEEMAKANNVNIPKSIRLDTGVMEPYDEEMEESYDCIKFEEMNPAPVIARQGTSRGKPLPPLPIGLQTDRPPAVRKTPSPSSINSLLYSSEAEKGKMTVKAKPGKGPPIAPKPKPISSSIPECEETEYETFDEEGPAPEYDDIKAVVQNSLFLRAFTTHDIELSSFKTCGLFYIRESTTQNNSQNQSSQPSYTLCVSVNNQTRKFKIRQEGDAFYLDTMKQQQFKEMDELLLYYQKNPIPSKAHNDLKLLTPFRDLCENTGS